MRIDIVLRILWTAGAQKLAIEETKRLSKLGHDVRLVFLRGSPLGGYSDLLESVNYVILSNDGNSFLSPLFQYLTRAFFPDRGVESRVDLNLLIKYPFWARQNMPDLVICHDQWAGFSGLLSNALYGIPYIVYLHERPPSYEIPLLGRLARIWEGAVLGRAARVEAVTSKVAESYSSHQSIDPVPNWVGMDGGKSRYALPQPKEIIAVSMWDYGRKPTLYLDLLQEIPEYSLNMVGRWRIPALKSEFVKRMQELNLTGRVRLYEGISESTLYDLYDRSRFAMRFGFGEYGMGTLVEAMSRGLPVIVNNDLGIAPIIRAHNAGLVLSDIDPKTIREFIKQAEHADVYGLLVNNVRELTKKYTWDRHCQLLLGDVVK